MPHEYVKCKSEIIKKTNHPLCVSEILINRPLTRPHTFTLSPLLPLKPHHVDRDHLKTWTFGTRKKIALTKIS